MATSPRAAPTTFQEQTLELIRAAPLVGLSAAVPGGLKVATTPNTDSNLLGMVRSKTPNTIILNAELAAPSVNGGMKHAIPHEWEHVLQYQAGSTYGKSYDAQVADSYTALGGSRPKLKEQLERSAASSTLNSHLEKLVGSRVAPYLGKMPGGQYSLREQFAELSSLEALSKKDLTKDPVVRAEFFGNDQALVDVYKATTGYRTQRLDSKDLPPMTSQPTAPEPSVLSKILSTVKGAVK